VRRPSVQPPAWYADSRHASALRYWDGRRWTSRWRPVPGWAGTALPAPARGPEQPGTPGSAPSGPAAAPRAAAAPGAGAAAPGAGAAAPGAAPTAPGHGGGGGG